MILAICHTHDLSWDLDMDPPQCGCEYDIMVFEEQELPFYETLSEPVSKVPFQDLS